MLKLSAQLLGSLRSKVLCRTVELFCTNVEELGQWWGYLRTNFFYGQTLNPKRCGIYPAAWTFTSCMLDGAVWCRIFCAEWGCHSAQNMGGPGYFQLRVWRHIPSCVFEGSVTYIELSSCRKPSAGPGELFVQGSRFASQCCLCLNLFEYVLHTFLCVLLKNFWARHGAQKKDVIGRCGQGGQITKEFSRHPCACGSKAA